MPEGFGSGRQSLKEQAGKFQMKNQVAFLLRGGVLLCLLIIAFGLWLRLNQKGNAELIHALMRGENISVPAGKSFFLNDIAILNPDSIIALGLAVLIALPILRVILISFIFLIEKEWIFFIITILVLVALFAGPFFHL